MEKAKFSPEDGIKIQTEHLNNWKKVLQPEVYEALHEYALRDNSKATDGYQICRGSSLSCYVENYMLGHRK